MIPFGGPTTQELTQRLMLNNNCKTSLSSIYNWKNKEVNFEFLLSSIENLLDWKLANEDNSINLVNSNLLVEPIFQYRFTSLRDIWDIYREAVNEIIEGVREYDHNISSCPKKLNSLANFVICKSKTSD